MGHWDDNRPDWYKSTADQAMLHEQRERERRARELEHERARERWQAWGQQQHQARRQVLDSASARKSSAQQRKRATPEATRAAKKGDPSGGCNGTWFVVGAVLAGVLALWLAEPGQAGRAYVVGTAALVGGAVVGVYYRLILQLIGVTIVLGIVDLILVAWMASETSTDQPATSDPSPGVVRQADPVAE